MVKKITTYPAKCHRCNGTGIVQICDRCGSEIYRYENGIPICSKCTSPDGIRWAMSEKGGDV